MIAKSTLIFDEKDLCCAKWSHINKWFVYKKHTESRKMDRKNRWAISKKIFCNEKK